MQSLVRGGTRWRRFAVVMVPSVAATAAIGVALGQGALAASFSVSGQQFKVSADKLVGDGFVQYGAYDAQVGGKNIPVAVSAFKHAEITKMCQSVVTPNVPLVGPVTMKLSAGTGKNKPVVAENLFIDLDQLDADAEFTNINIGIAAGAATKGQPMDPKTHASPGGFAQEADKAVLTDVKQTAWATSAGTFKLNNLSLKLLKGVDECY